ncbi:hypothetical protein [Desulfosporosinus burensis]
MPDSPSLARLAAVHIPVHCPVSGVGRLNGSLLFCLRKDVALVSHCVPGLGRGTGDGRRRNGGFWGRRHISCAPSCLGQGRKLGTDLDLHDLHSLVAHVRWRVTLRPWLGSGNGRWETEERWILGETAHFMCTVLV